MQRILIAILFAFVTKSSLLAQYYMITFDGTGYYESAPGHQLYIDNISNPNNMWQIGQPQKPVFNNTMATTNAIVTNTLTTYPVNNTSSFVLWHLAGPGFTMPSHVHISGNYFVNSDTLNDYGSIEFSPDNGTTWINLLTSTTYSSNIFWNNPYIKPTLSGNSNGWKRFKANIEDFGPIFNIQGGDTVRFRFSFTSDGNQTNKDGLMFDSISVWDVPPIGLNDLMKNKLELKTYPIPSTTSVSMEFKDKNEADCVLKVYDNLGKIKFEKIISTGEKSIVLNIRDYATGIYNYTISTKGGNILQSGKFVKSE